MRLAPAGWIDAIAVASTVVAFTFLERRWPLRRRVERALRHDLRNLVLAALAGVTLALVQTPLVLPLTVLVARRGLGLLKLVALPPAIEALLAIALMDYTLYVWHVLMHKVDLLWRFHQAHHVDLDLSTTTGLRFHFGEMLLSMPFRAAQVVLLGVSPGAFAIWQTLTTVQILFHHSNVRLPLRLERWLSCVIVTPRMHGIHHSTVQRETDSNWATIFSFYDRVHRTLRLDVPQDAITIGVPAYRDPDEVTLWKSLALPFRRTLYRWTRPGQTAPERAIVGSASTTLAR